MGHKRRVHAQRVSLCVSLCVSSHQTGAGQAELHERHLGTMHYAACAPVRQSGGTGDSLLFEPPTEMLFTENDSNNAKLCVVTCSPAMGVACCLRSRSPC